MKSRNKPTSIEFNENMTVLIQDYYKNSTQNLMEKGIVSQMELRESHFFSQNILKILFLS